MADVKRGKRTAAAAGASNGKPGPIPSRGPMPIDRFFADLGADLKMRGVERHRTALVNRLSEILLKHAGLETTDDINPDLIRRFPAILDKVRVKARGGAKARRKL